MLDVHLQYMYLILSECTPTPVVTTCCSWNPVMVEAYFDTVFRVRQHAVLSGSGADRLGFFRAMRMVPEDVERTGITGKEEKQPVYGWKSPISNFVCGLVTSSFLVCKGRHGGLQECLQLAKKDIKYTRSLHRIKYMYW
jgi:hypothetical protein